MAQYLITNEKKDIPFEGSNDEIARVVQNAKNLLMTRMAEVPYDRLRGFDMALYDLPFPDFQFELPAEVERLLLWEPRVRVVSAEASLETDREGLFNGILIQVVIDVQIEE